MGKLYDMLAEDFRFQEGMNSCMNCGICTAICPAAEFYQYDPRHIINIVQSRDEEAIEALLKSEAIWYCGECMSCVTRCPRKNAVGLIIVALRTLSQRMGYFTESEKGRQQLALKRTVGTWILEHGYCIYPRKITFENHPEAGPIWKWEQENLDSVHKRLGSNLDGEGNGGLRKIPQESLDELQRIFDVTGGSAFYENIEACSKKKADEMGLTDAEYFQAAYINNSGTHGREE